MSKRGQSEELLSQFPGPVFIRPKKRTQYLTIAGVLAIGASVPLVGINFWSTTLSVTLLLIALFGIYVKFSDQYLRLDGNGFAYTQPLAKLRSYKWAQVSNFEPYVGGGSFRVPRAIDKRLYFEDDTPAFQRRWGRPSIPLFLYFDVNDLADLMKQWREKALAGSLDGLGKQNPDLRG